MKQTNSFDSALFDGIAIFVGLVNSKSFTKAAQESGHSTSHISKQIGKLEERLGVRLLNRTTRKLSLTVEGSSFYEHCQQIVLDTQQAQFALFGQQQEPVGRLKISCPVRLGVSKFKQIFSDFMTAYPKVELDIELNDRQVDLVAEGFDLAIRASGKLADSSLVSRKIIKDHILVLASPDYLNIHGYPKIPTELKQHKTIRYSNVNQPNIWHYIDHVGDSKTVNVSSHVLCNSAELEVALCVEGKGIMQMPRFNLGSELEDGRLIELFSDYPKQPVDVYMVYPSRKYMSSKVRSFIDFVVNEIQ